MLLASIDAAADDEAINGIIKALSSGKQAMLYSALLYTSTAMGAEQTKANRLHALQNSPAISFLRIVPMTDRQAALKGQRRRAVPPAAR